ALTTLVGPGSDAHAYEPRPADAAAVRDADLVLANGLHFEGFLPRLIEASESRARAIEASHGITPLSQAGPPHGHDDQDGHGAHEARDDHDDHDEAGSPGHAHHHGAYDPHAWQDVANAMVYVDNIADAFCQADPAGCGSY